MPRCRGYSDLLSYSLFDVPHLRLSCLLWQFMRLTSLYPLRNMRIASKRSSPAQFFLHKSYAPIHAIMALGIGQGWLSASQTMLCKRWYTRSYLTGGHSQQDVVAIAVLSWPSPDDTLGLYSTNKYSMVNLNRIILSLRPPSRETCKVIKIIHQSRHLDIF